MKTFKRFTIILLLATMLFVLQYASSESLWLNQPNSDDIIQTIETLQERSKEIQELMAEALQTDPDAGYKELFKLDEKHTFVIDFKQTTLDQMIADLQQYYSIYGTYQLNTYYPVNVYYQVNDTPVLFTDVGFRLTGSTDERRLPINDTNDWQDIHFLLKFNETFDTTMTSQTYIRLKTREFAGIEELIFRYNSNNDPSHSKTIFGHQMARKAGVNAPNATYTEVVFTVDETIVHQSLYTMIEQIDEEFIRRQFDVDDVGNLYEANDGATLELISDPTVVGIKDESIFYTPLYERRSNEEHLDYTDIIDVSTNLHTLEGAALQVYLDTHINVDAFLRMSAMHILLGHVDDYRSYGRNVYYYFDESNYMTVIPSSYTNILGVGWTGEPTFINNTLGNDIYEWGQPMWTTFSTPLWDTIIADESNQELYESYLIEFLDTLFTQDAFMNQYLKAKSLYGDTYSFQIPNLGYFSNKALIVRDQVAYYEQQRSTE
ncbi:CotH kinase family protein [Candidatus Xianfuyuplasma coldseepsis]|uniref:CotH protein n=1 Tax=Candidatus Xianfuyuplasma coldseepsis TaxID=2782163 RepID=A0A7L7KRM2_9MOLU|nr:CotH kinase family protein [Xianfuyuplasma coldseepsis]QMS84448.1 hypothetical protein G4Z02_01375 [Xianfuyuplasma coldseepsis]